MTSPRPAKPTIEQIREICQPPAIRGRQTSEHWLNDVYLRKLSPYVTRILLKTSISANGVTWLMILTGFLAGASLLLPGVWGGLLAFVLGQKQMLIDCCDGEVARWRETSSPAGIFLDKIGHYIAEGFIPIALGIRVADMHDSGNAQFIIMGLVLSILLIFNKALNDMVHVARAFNGLDRLSEAPSANAPRSRGLGAIRRFAKVIPFHRLFHSVEMTTFAFVAALLDAFVLVDSSISATQMLLVALLACASITVPGHVVAIMSSSRLRK